MHLIEALIRYADGEIASGDVRLARVELGDERLRVVVIKILGWLKSQHRLGRFRELALKKDHTWCADVELLIAEKELFLDTFQIGERGITFADGMTNGEKAKMCAAVDDGFTPRLMTKSNRPGVTAYEVIGDAPAAFGRTVNNPQFGSGRFPQIGGH